jgi:hypothetical protein
MPVPLRDCAVATSAYALEAAACGLTHLSVASQQLDYRLDTPIL